MYIIPQKLALVSLLKPITHNLTSGIFFPSVNQAN